MPLKFTKMHGLGNDFMVIDAIEQNVHLTSQDIIALARRDKGVGFDQCLLIEPGKEPGVDFFYRIFNANGEEVGQCGNGARCLARFARHYQLTDKNRISVATKTTKMNLQINDDNSVTVDFGPPNLLPNKIPLRVDKQAPLYFLPLQNGSLHPIHALSVGNPHAITLVHNQETPVTTLGQEISEHPWFPEQTNAGFMEIVDKNHLILRVYERGCGETMACGSGAIAAAAAGKLFHQMDSTIHIQLLGGELLVEWPDETGPIYLTGPATFVYEGNLCE